MSFDKILGPAMVVYMISATVAALWWASDLTRRVTTVETSTVSAERIARLEVEVRGLGESTKDLKTSVRDLVRELRSE
jgi:uncharacterized protein YlxW (UPF0749 family)